MLSRLGSAAADRGSLSSCDPLDMWLNGALILEDGDPVNPVDWWVKQKALGNMHGGLVHMALDILSCPGEKLHTNYSNHPRSLIVLNS